MTHLYVYLGGEDEINEEESDKDDEAKERFVRKQGWSKGHEAAGDNLANSMRLVTIMMTTTIMLQCIGEHLQESKQGGDSSDEQEEEKESGPEPAKAD